MELGMKVITLRRLFAIAIAVTVASVIAVAAPAASAQAESSSNSSGMNHAEASWCAWPSRYKLCREVYVDEARWAMGHAVDCATPDPCTNGEEQNALQHCLWTTIMTLRHGRDTAHEFLTRHESDSNDAADTQRDWNNNDLGFMIASIIVDEQAADPSIEDKTAALEWCMFVVESNDLDFTDNPNPSPLATR
jgi:hypothetical protein